MKGAIRRTFRDGTFVILRLACPPSFWRDRGSQRPRHSKHFFSPDSIFLSHHNIFRNIALSALVRKLDNTPNGMLVTPKYAINSRTDDNIDFAGSLAKVAISGVIKKTTQLLALAYILQNSLTPQKGVLARSRARVNWLITG